MQKKCNDIRISLLILKYEFMTKAILIIGTALLGLAITIGIIGMRYFSSNKINIINFIKENPDKAAITLIRNNKIIANKNAERLQPLASTVKIIIAIEYAEQAANGTINPETLIPLKELDTYYAAYTDGGAHTAWLKYVEPDIKDNKISIRNIAKGMILFSSNANTEWLQHKLGLKNINNRIKTLGIENHSEIYYLVSSLFVGKEAFPQFKRQGLQIALKGMPLKNYIASTEIIHNKLLSDTLYKKDLGDLSMPIQKIWSDNLPASTTKEYAKLMQKFNSKTYFTPNVQTLLDDVMEGLMQSPRNKANLKHAGTKGGSTSFVLTKAFYATDKKGNTTELALFFNNLTPTEAQQLTRSLNDFIITILFDESFLNAITNTLKE